MPSQAPTLGYEEVLPHTHTHTHTHTTSTWVAFEFTKTVIILSVKEDKSNMFQIISTGQRKSEITSDHTQLKIRALER